MVDEHMSDAEMADTLAILCDFAEEHGWPAPGLEAVRALARTLHRKLLENRLCNMFMRDFPNATVYGHHGIEGLLVQAERRLARHLRAGRCSQAEFAEGVRLCAQLREAGCVPSREVEEEIDRLMRPASEDPANRDWLRRTFTLADHRPRPQSVTIDPVAVSAEDTTITLTDARYVMIGDVIDFGGEVMGVIAAPDITTNTVVVARGLRGTVATGHAPGAVGRLIGNTRTGGEIIDPVFTVAGDAAERSRRVREDLDLAPPDWTSYAVGVNPPASTFRAADDAERAEIERRANIDATIRRLEEETTAARARAEAGQLPCKFDTPEGRAELERMRRDLAGSPVHYRPSLRAERMTRARARLAELSDSGLPEDRERLIDLVTQARRWVADDLEVGELTPEDARERLRLLDELEGRAEGA